MPLDTSIALQTRGIQLDNPVEVQGRALTLRALMAQQQQADEDRARQRALDQAYSGNTGQDGTVNMPGVLGYLAGRGAGRVIPQVLKSQADQQKTLADLAHVQAQTGEATTRTAGLSQDQAIKAHTQALQRLAAVQSPQDMNQWLLEGVRSGALTSEKAAAATQQLQSDPASFQQMRQQLLMTGVEAAKQIEMTRANPTALNTGQQNITRDTNPMSPTFGQQIMAPVRMQQSPDSVASLAQADRHFGKSQEQAMQLANQGVTYQQDNNGNFVALPTKAAPGNVVRGMPVVAGPGMQPLQGSNGTLNDTQSKALLFGARMKESDKVLGELGAKGVNTPSLTKMAAESVPLVGGALGMAANSLIASPEQQQVEQAQRDFVNAVLRRESGAAISASEFDSAKKQYFPQPGDSPGVKQQKSQNRQLAIRGLLSEVPASKQTMIDAPAADTSVPPDIAAILRKHGGK